ncbi:MAG: tetratricopeptide repeat protein [Planctomycetes bacterium]|nr:tetratricopeptide repeat protein [Planctomycetota bacterium]
MGRNRGASAATVATERAADQFAAAEAALERGDVAKAERAAQAARRGFARWLGADHPDVGGALALAAEIAARRGDRRGAVARSEAAVALLARAARRHRGAVEVARMHGRALGQLGMRLREAGDYAAAGRCLRRALALARRRFGPRDPEAAGAMNQLGIWCKYTDRFSEGERLYRAALALTVRERGPRHPEVAAICHNLGGLFHEQEQFRRAEPFARRAARIYVATLGPDHPDTVADRAALAAVLIGVGRLAEAERLLRGALRWFARHFGRDHYEVAVNLGNLAALLHQRGRRVPALRMQRRALALYEQSLGPTHPETARAAQNLAALLGPAPRHRRAVAQLLAQAQRGLARRAGRSARPLPSGAP